MAITTFPIETVELGDLSDGIAIETYGAVGDMVYGVDAAITSGTDDFTSASANFTLADIGKPIVVNGAGAAGVPLITTIIAWGSATAVQLGANASTTVSGNKLYYYGTDDTNAFQDAIDAAATNGGKILLGKKSYLVGALEFPVLQLFDLINPFQVVHMVGTSPPPGRHWNDGISYIVDPPVEGFSIVQFYPGTGTLLKVAAGLSGPGPTAISFVAEKINFRVPVLKAVTGLDLRRLATVILQDVTVDTAFDNFSGHPEPPVGSVGVYLPQEWNDALCKGRNLSIANFDEGLHTHEHADLDDIWIWRCQKALVPHGGSHAQAWGHIQPIWCPYVVYYGGDSLGIEDVHVRAFLLDIEDAYPGHWAEPIAHIYDPTDKIKGELAVHRVVSNVGFVAGWTKDGGANVGVVQFNLSPAPAVLFRTNFGHSTHDESPGWPADGVAGQAFVFHGVSTNNWTIADGWGIQNGSNGIGMATLDAGITNFKVSCRVKTSPTASRVRAGVTIKLIDSNNQLAVWIAKTATLDEVELFKTVAGVYTQIATGMDGTITTNTEYFLEVEYADNSVVVKVDGAVIITYTLTSAESTLFDAETRASCSSARDASNDDGGSQWKSFKAVPV